MGKKSTKKSAVPEQGSSEDVLVNAKNDIDPALASLFSTSAGPVTAPPRHGHISLRKKVSKDDESASDVDEELSSLPPEELEASSDGEGSSAEVSDDEEDSAGSSVSSELSEAEITVPKASSTRETQTSSRKRKRKQDGEEIEDVYMRQLARREAQQESEHLREKRSKHDTGLQQPAGDGEADGDGGTEGADDSDALDVDAQQATADRSSSVPLHESLGPSKSDVELEKSSRTVFLGNVATAAITSKSSKKELMNHLSSFLAQLPTSNTPHKLESLRFRSTAYGSALPKKAAFVKKELLDATTKSTNAYAVYSTQLAAREAAKRLNGTVVLDRHLRVDEVAHPAKTDHLRCVFVGNLGFVDDESAVQAAAEEQGKPKSKKKEPGDVEEGLWREFGKCGTVESVRVVRDSQTRVGKGFAYVQFKDANAVEAALLYNDKKFPPMLPRKLRVVRAKAMKRNKNKQSTTTSSKNGLYKPKADPKEQSMRGRAQRLLGKAGAAQARSGTTNAKPSRSIKPIENFVFEGHRATASQGKKGLRLGGKGKGHGKPKTRSSQRAAAWKSKNKNSGE